MANCNRVRQRAEEQPELQLSSICSSYHRTVVVNESSAVASILKSNLPNYFNYFLVKKHKTHLCVLIFSFPLFPSVSRCKRSARSFPRLRRAWYIPTSSLWLLLIKSLVNLLRNLANPTPARTIRVGVQGHWDNRGSSRGARNRLLNAISDGRVRVLPVWSRQMESRLYGSLWPTTTTAEWWFLIVSAYLDWIGVCVVFFFNFATSMKVHCLL